MKRLFKILIPIVLLALLLLVFYFVDKDRVSKNKPPLFCIKTQTYRDGGSTVYMGAGYKVIIYRNTNDDNELYSFGNWSLEFDNPYSNADAMKAPLPIVYSYFENLDEGIAVCMGDQAMGTYALQIYHTKDRGKNWTLATQNHNDFIAVTTTATFLFINNQVGFICNPSRSDNDSRLMMTTNGGKTFEYITFVDDSVVETFENGNQLKKNEIYDFYNLPTYTDGVLSVIVSQGADGDYMGGKTSLEYKSYNMGEYWEYVREFSR